MTFFINDSGESLYTESNFYITKQIATFKNFSIKGDVSVNFSLPLNKETRSALGYYGLNQSSNPAFSQQSFTVYKDGNKISRGVVVIQRDLGDKLDCFFISGNANWFKLFQFSCKDIRNSALSVQANITSVQTAMGINSSGTIVSDPITEGIVFPFIDILYKGQKFDNYFMDSAYKDRLGASAFIAVEIYPALFVRTLVNELSKVAGVKISGTLLSDAFYKTLIITPESAEIIDPETETVLDMIGLYTSSAANYITVGSLAPDMKAIDFIKWLCFSFGCIPVFDVYAQTLTLNILDKVQKEDALDWSEYFRGSSVYYEDVVENNYIRVTKAPESVFDAYNQANAVKYGELNITSDSDGNDEAVIYTSPFAPVKDYVGDTPFAWATPYVPIFELTDDQAYTYSSVTIGTNGTATFNGTGYPFTSLSDYIIFRVVDDSGVYDGFHTTYSTVAASSTTITSKCDFISTSTGTIYTQSIKQGKPGARILSYVPRLDATEFTLDTSFYKGNPSAGNGYTDVATAYYFKTVTSYPVLNTYKKGLSYGDLNTTMNDFSLENTYLNSFKAIIKSPKVRAYFQLPESVFSMFDFSDYVYVNTEEIKGYFFVESIVNYKDAGTNVEVNMYKV